MKKERILLIAPSAYGFHKSIKKAIENKGHKVTFVDEHILPNSMSIRRYVMKSPRKILEELHNAYIKSSIASNIYDRVILIRGEFINAKTIKWMKNNLKEAKFIMYQWDSKIYLPLLGEQIGYFDKIYSFDKNDSLEYGFVHKPLFFSNEHVNKSTTENEYKFCFVGTDHTDRAKVIFDFIKENNIKKNDLFLHLCRAKLSIVLNILKRTRAVKKSYLPLYSVYPLNPAMTMEQLAKSEHVLDITPINQSGLTMRTMEALGLKKKIITTNEEIKQYDFYDPNNIYVFSRENLKIPEGFLAKKHKEVNADIYNKYLIDHWVDDFLQG